MSQIPLASPDIRQSDIDLVKNILMSGMLVQGKYVVQLENEISKISQSKNSIALSNGTATMHLALVSLGIGKGDEVIVPAFSYIATANVVEIVGAKPVFVDINSDTFNIDVNRIEDSITSKTKAIIPVHEFGLACEIHKIMTLAKKYNLFVIEDAACALGATINDQPVGSFGDFASFSLHPRKSITSGEGGILNVKENENAKKIRQLRNHGIEIIDGKMEFVEAGYNYRMTDFQAALAIGQLSRFKETLVKKSKLAQIYFNHITNDKIKLPITPKNCNHSWQSFHIILDDSLGQANVINSLKKEGIGVNYGAQCIPSQKYYKSKYGFDASKFFPNAYRAYSKGIVLPLYEKLSKENILYISKKVNELC